MQLHWAALAGILLPLSNCTTVLYNGPGRPKNQVAVIERGDSKISMIDDRAVPDSSYYEVLPGVHAVKMQGEEHSVEMHVLYSTAVIRRDRPLRVCMLARPGHTYSIVSSRDGEAWTYDIIDESTDKDVVVDCPRGGPTR